MKRVRRLALAFGIAAAGCVSQLTETPAPFEASASVPSADEVRAKEEADARERRKAFVDGELRFALDHAEHAPPAGPPADR